jgi:hypothetical protein
MFADLIKNMLPRVVQDLVTSAAALLVAHGFINADQTQGFIGSAFFIAMLIVNYFIANSRKAAAAQAGGMAVAAVSNDIPTSPTVVATIIKESKTP